MAGSKREKKPGVWELRVSVGRDASGRYQYVSRTVQGGAREADRQLRALVAEVERGGISERRQITLAELLAEWMETNTSGARPLATTTRNAYRYLIRQHIGPALGSRRIDKLTPFELDRFYGALLAKGLAPATARKAHNVIRRALGQAVRWGWIADNPAARAQPPSVPAPEVKVPTPEDIAALLSEAERYDPRIAVFLWLAATTGARRGELCGLRWSDVDLEGGFLTISRSIAMNDEADKDGPAIVVKDTKTHQARTLRLDGGTVIVLNGHRNAMEKLARDAGGILPEAAWVFSTDLFGQKPYRPESFTHAFTRIRARAGLHHLKLHSLRHFMATMALTAGHDVRTVAGRGGWRNPNVLLNVYAHFLPSPDQAIADDIGRLLQRPDEDEPPKAIGA